MTSKLDLDLATIIANEQKSSRPHRGGRGGGRGGRGAAMDRSGRGSGGPVRTSRGGNRERDAPYDRRSSWQHDKYQQPPVAESRVRGDTIFVSNLDKEVTKDDVHDIFSRVGQVKSAIVNYDQTGASLGTGEVSFRSSVDAETAVREYDGAEVDGRVMHVKLIGSFVRSPQIVKKAPPPPPPPAQVAPQRQPREGGGRNGASTERGETRRGGDKGGRGNRGRRGGRGGRGGGRGKAPTQESLDAEMESYQNSRGKASGGDEKME